MLKKEFRDIIKPVLAILSVSLIVPLLALLKVSLHGTFYFLVTRVYKVLKSVNGDVYILSFVFLLGFLIFWTANMLGFAAFKYEHKDRAFEYLLSFPLSRYRILRHKFISRFIVLLSLTAIYEILAATFLIKLRPLQGSLFFLFDLPFFPLWVLFFFLAGFFIGLFEQKNWIAVISITTFMSTILVSLAIKTLLHPGDTAAFNISNLNGTGFACGTFIIMAVLGAAFFSVYRKFDIKSPHIHARRFTLLALPPLIFLIVGSIFILIKA